MRSGSQWPLRLAGSLFGIGSCLIGLYSLLGAADQPELSGERATGFGIFALVVGAVALSARSQLATCMRSGTARRRWRLFRDDL